jgi:hypothetical protein
MPNVSRVWKSLWAQSMVLLGGVCQVKARFDPFGDSVNLNAREVHGLRRTYHRLKIILGTPDGTLR